MPDIATASATHANALDPWVLIKEASPIVQFVLLVLCVMSLTSWIVIGIKYAQIKRAAKTSLRFLELFWRSDTSTSWNTARLETIYAQLRMLLASPIARLFQAGYTELARLGERQSTTSGLDAAAETENIERAVARAKVNEITQLEGLLTVLATTGSIAPFIGLFGTVWGIMNSFMSIGNQHGAGLDVVAPGIAEALIATAVGLAAAIPAVMAYNYFVRRIRIFEGEMDVFANDFINVLRRHFLVG